MKICLLLIMIVCGVTHKSAAQLNTSFSGRFSVNGKGASIQYHIDAKRYAEAMFLSTHCNRRVTFTGMYQEQYPIGGKFKVFRGVGLHAGYRKISQLREILEFKFNDFVIIREVMVDEKKFIAGADAIGGINYYLTPKIWLGLDIKPYVDFINRESFFIDAGMRIGASL